MKSIKDKPITISVITIVLLILILFVINIFINSPDIVIFQKYDNEIQFVHHTSLTKKQIFKKFADIQNYPEVLPLNIKEVNIINRTTNVIFAEETINELWVEEKLQVKHELFPYDKHVIQIVSGEANGTNIILTFKESKYGSEIHCKVELHISGAMALFVSALTDKNIQSIISTIITAFERS